MEQLNQQATETRASLFHPDTRALIQRGDEHLVRAQWCAGVTLILPFLPMRPIQILLNNLIYNVSEIAIPFDNVDPETVLKPLKWDIKLIERFMLVFGPVSSVFDFMTYAMLAFFHAGEALFQTGWFEFDMVTQTLVVFCIRTRRLFFRRKPGGFLAVMATGAIAAPQSARTRRAASISASSFMAACK